MSSHTGRNAADRAWRSGYSHGYKGKLKQYGDATFYDEYLEGYTHGQEARCRMLANTGGIIPTIKMG